VQSAGRQLLPGSGFPRDQNGRAARGNQADNLDDLLNLGAFSHQTLLPGRSVGRFVANRPVELTEVVIGLVINDLSVIFGDF
jgi:hypothetical protein